MIRPWLTIPLAAVPHLFDGGGICCPPARGTVQGQWLTEPRKGNGPPVISAQSGLLFSHSLHAGQAAIQFGGGLALFDLSTLEFPLTNRNQSIARSWLARTWGLQPEAGVLWYWDVVRSGWTLQTPVGQRWFAVPADEQAGPIRLLDSGETGNPIQTEEDPILKHKREVAALRIACIRSAWQHADHPVSP